MPADKPDLIRNIQKTILEEFIELTPGESWAHTEFDALASDTLKEIQNLGGFVTTFRPHPDSGMFGLKQIHQTNAGVSTECLKR